MRSSSTCCFVLVLLCAAFAAIAIDSAVVLPNLRIEGSTTTIYEGPMLDYGRDVTTPSGGTHLCDGTNDGANTKPAGTCTGALANAAALANFPFDGTYDTEFQDFFITSIGPDTETATEFWGLLLDFQFTAVGGCQQEVKTGDDILWAFNAFNADYFLKLTGPNEGVKGKTIKVTVTDGSSGVPIAGASVGGATTGADGTAEVKLTKVGIESFKATAPNSIRSNALPVIVL